MDGVGVQLGTQGGLRFEVRIGQGLLRGTQGAPHLVGSGKPQTCGDVQRVFAQRVDLFHHRAQVLQMPCGLRRGRGDLGMHLFDVTQGGRIGHPQAFHTLVQTRQKIQTFKRQGGPVACIGLADGVHHQRRILHGHGMWPQMRHRTKGRQGVSRHAAKAGLQAHIAAKSGWDAHTASAIGAHGQRPQASGHRRRRTTRGAPRCVVQIPGVAADACEQRIGFAFATKFGGGGFAQQHGTGFAQTRSDGRIHLPGLIGVDGLAAAQRGPAAREDQVFDGHRHAVQSRHRCAIASVGLPAQLALPRTGHGRLFVHQAKRIEQRVELLDALQHRLRGLHGRSLTTAVKRQQLRGGA